MSQPLIQKSHIWDFSIEEKKICDVETKAWNKVTCLRPYRRSLTQPCQKDDLLGQGLISLVKSLGQSCLTLCNPMDCSPPGFSIHGILQAKILEWVVISFSEGSSWPRDWTHVSCLHCQVDSLPPHHLGSPRVLLQTVTSICLPTVHPCFIATRETIWTTVVRPTNAAVFITCSSTRKFADSYTR